MSNDSTNLIQEDFGRMINDLNNRRNAELWEQQSISNTGRQMHEREQMDRARYQRVYEADWLSGQAVKEKKVRSKWNDPENKV